MDFRFSYLNKKSSRLLFEKTFTGKNRVSLVLKHSTTIKEAIALTRPCYKTTHPEDVLPSIISN